MGLPQLAHKKTLTRRVNLHRYNDVTYLEPNFRSSPWMINTGQGHIAREFYPFLQFVVIHKRREETIFNFHISAIY